MRLDSIRKLDYFGSNGRIFEIGESFCTECFFLRTSRMCSDGIIRAEFRRGKDLVNTPASITTKSFITQVNIASRTNIATMVAPQAGCDWIGAHSQTNRVSLCGWLICKKIFTGIQF